MIRLFLSAWMLTIQTPDSTARAQMSDALVGMADSLTGLRGASAQFVRDLENARPEQRIFVLIPPRDAEVPFEQVRQLA